MISPFPDALGTHRGQKAPRAHKKSCQEGRFSLDNFFVLLTVHRPERPSVHCLIQDSELSPVLLEASDRFSIIQNTSTSKINGFARDKNVSETSAHCMGLFKNSILKP